VALAWVRCQVSPCEICGGQGGTGLGSIPGQFVWDLWWTGWHWPEFDARSVRVSFMVDRVALGRDFSPITSVLPFLYYSTKSSVLLYTLLLPEGKTDEAWRTSKKHRSFGKSESIG